MSCTFFSLCRVHFALCRVLFNKKKFNNKKNYFERFGKFHSAHRQTAHVLKFKTEIPITYIYIYIYIHTLSLSLFWHVCQNTRKLRSCSFSTCHIVYVVFTFTFLISNIEAFGSLLQLPLSGSTRTRPRSKRVLFVGDFGAQGDGVNDDTEVDYCWPNFCYQMIMSFFFTFFFWNAWFCIFSEWFELNWVFLDIVDCEHNFLF